MSKKSEDESLTDQQILFCNEYLIDLNGTQAAIRAKYSEDTAPQQGSRLLSIVKVQEKIFELSKDRMRRLELNSDNVIAELVKLANSDLREVFDDNGCVKPMNEWPAHISICVSSFEVYEDLQSTYGGVMCRECQKIVYREKVGETKKIRFWDKTKSLELLGKHLKLFSDKLELSGNKENPVVVESHTLNVEQIQEKINILLEKRNKRIQE